MAGPAKVVVFAHVPPPHHGQSTMVRLLLEGLRDERWGIVGGPLAASAPDDRPCGYHVDARVSDDLQDVGGMRPGKLWRLLQCCISAVRHRICNGARTLYYIPAPARRSAVLRDLVVLLLVRPWFPRIIFHWHALGLAPWIMHGEASGERPLFGAADPLLRAILKRVTGGAHLSIALAPDGEAEAALLKPRQSILIPNGIPDPCPDYDTALRDSRLARADALRAGSAGSIRLLYLAACTLEKGLFDALDAMDLLPALLPVGTGIELTIAGTFVSPDERARFDARMAGGEGGDRPQRLTFTLTGQMDPTAKARLLAEHDCLLVPSHRESFGLTLLEAMGAGLELAAADLPSFRAILGPLAPGRIATRQPGESAGAALARGVASALRSADPNALRARYVAAFGVTDWARAMSDALATAAAPAADR